MNPEKTALSQWRKTLRRRLWMLAAMRYMPLFILFPAGLLLAVRFGAPHQLLPIGFALTLIAYLASVYRFARRLLPDQARLIAFLDQYNQAGGSLMTAFELGRELPRIENLPGLKLSFKPFVGSNLSALLFFTAVFLLPNRWIQQQREFQLDAGKETARLRTKLAVLDEAELAEEAVLKDIEQQIAEIEKLADAEEPVETMTALEHMDQRLTRMAERGYEELEKATRQQEALRTAADRLSQERVSLDQGLFTNAARQMRELTRYASEREAFEKFLEENFSQQLKQPSEDLSDLLSQIPEGMRLTADDLRNLRRRMREAGMNAPGSELMSLSREELEKIIRDLAQGKTEVGALLMAISGDEGESGTGAGRGPGTTDLEFTANTQKDGQFKDLMVNSDVVDPGDDTLIAVTFADPESQTTVENHGDALRNSRDGSGGSHNHTILPKHRAAVGRYFERSEK